MQDLEKGCNGTFSTRWLQLVENPQIPENFRVCGRFLGENRSSCCQNRPKLGRLTIVKTLAYLILTATVVAAIAYCVYFYRVPLGLVNPGGNPIALTQAAANPEPGLAPRPEDSSWHLIDRSADGFRVDMPDGATESKVPSYTNRGEMEPVNMLQATQGSDETFAVTWADNPPVAHAARENAEKTLDMAQDGALARTQTRLTAEVNTIRLGYPARDFASRGSDGGMMEARMILAGSRLYMLIVSFTGANAQHDEDVSRFFNSFELTE
jgi:hypothetical protein